MGYDITNLNLTNKEKEQINYLLNSFGFNYMDLNNNFSPFNKLEKDIKNLLNKPEALNQEEIIMLKKFENKLTLLTLNIYSLYSICKHDEAPKNFANKIVNLNSKSIILWNQVYDKLENSSL